MDITALIKHLTVISFGILMHGATLYSIGDSECAFCCDNSICSLLGKEEMGHKSHSTSTSLIARTSLHEHCRDMSTCADRHVFEL